MKVKTDLRNINTLNKNIKSIKMDVIGYKAKEYIENQLRQELDKDGRRMPRYTQRWQNWRSNHGMSPGTVDLTITGQMLRSIDNIRKSKYSVVVGFNNMQAKRAALGVGRNKKRPIWFLGLNKKSNNKLIAWVRKKVLKLVTYK